MTLLPAAASFARKSSGKASTNEHPQRDLRGRSPAHIPLTSVEILSAREKTSGPDDRVHAELNADDEQHGGGE